MAFDSKKLQDIIQKICREEHGILAADESSGTIKKRFDSIQIESNKGNRRDYRDMLFATEGLEGNISGVILYDETVDQKDSNGVGFPQLLASKGIVPGIKVDMGKVEHKTFAPQTITRGLDGLEDRLASYTERSEGTLGFTKWRQVIDIGDGMPSEQLLVSSMDAMAQYALIAQHAGYVPITEPEVLMDGNHSIERCAEVTELTLRIMYEALERHGVPVELTLLKPNMVISGKASGVVDEPEAVAEATIGVFQKALPKNLPGIVFLSGGQTPEQATANLNAIGKLAGDTPWFISFSYGRALQEPCLKTWLGKAENVGAAQDALALRGRLNGAAEQGLYDPAMEKEGVAVSV